MSSEFSTFRRYGYDNEDDLEERLMNKTAKLKQITISLGAEIKDSNKYINGLDKDFENSKGFLQSTINRVGRLSKSGNCSLYLYLIMFSLFVFFVLYIVIKWFWKLNFASQQNKKFNPRRSSYIYLPNDLSCVK